MPSANKSGLALVACFFAALVSAFGHSPHDRIAALDVLPSRGAEPATYLVVVRGMLLRSEDAGASWRRTTTGLDNRGEITAIDHTEDGIAYLITDKESGYRSEDRGLTWTKFEQGIGSGIVRHLCTSGNTAWIATRRKVCRLIEGATEWEVIARTDHDISALAPGPSGVLIGGSAGQISLADGSSESARSVETSPNGDPISALHALDEGAISTLPETAKPTSFLQTPDGLFASTWHGGVLRSNDQGKTWTDISGGLSGHEQADQMGVPYYAALRSDGAGNLFLAGFNGLFRLSNGQDNWTEIQTIPLDLIVNLTAGNDHDTLLVGTYWRGVYQSTGDGVWNPFFTGGKPLGRSTDPLIRVHGVALSPNYSKDRTAFVGVRNEFFATRDDGGSWETLRLDHANEGRKVFPDRIVPSPAFARDHTVFVAGRAETADGRRGGVFRSTDGGNSFTRIAAHHGSYIQSLTVSPAFAVDQTLFCSTGRNQLTGGGHIFRSSDAGASWVEVGKSLELPREGAQLAVSPDFGSDGILFAGTEHGLHISHDRGEAWQRLDSDSFGPDAFVETIAISSTFAADRKLIVEVRGLGRFRSEDAGQTFRAVAAEVPFTRAWYYAPGEMLQFSGDTSLIGATVDRVYRSEVGGETFSPVLEAFPADKPSSTLAYTFALGFISAIGLAYLARRCGSSFKTSLKKSCAPPFSR